MKFYTLTKVNAKTNEVESPSKSKEGNRAIRAIINQGITKWARDCCFQENCRSLQRY
jgi:isopropylmalate/homocitrate/citramalate synthase